MWAGPNWRKRWIRCAINDAIYTKSDELSDESILKRDEFILKTLNSVLQNDGLIRLWATAPLCS